MARHKAPTQISVASIQERTLFHELVDRYWKPAAVVALLVSIAIVIPTWRKGQSHKAHLGVWDELSSQANLDAGGLPSGTPESMALFADRHQDSPVGGWAKGLEVGTDIQEDKLDDAEKAAAQLASLWPDHLLSKGRIYPGADGGAATLQDSIRIGKQRLDAWEKEHAMLFSNPPLPADAPKVRLNTSKGPIVVGLYIDRTPKHAENFLRNCREGKYNGTKFHRVVRGSLIQGGDPNTVSGEPESWGLGGEADAIENEDDPSLRHFKGALVAWRAPGATRSNGSQFLVMTENQNQMDGQSVVFGMVLEGEATIQAIESGAVVGDRPQDPAVIESTEVL